MNTWNSFMFQDSSSPISEKMLFFHDLAMMMISMITVMISYIFMNIIVNKLTDRFLLENQTIEMIWTIIPMIILMMLAIPSLKVLYLSDDFNNVNMTIKCIGHQWYWSYEYSDLSNKIEFESFMIKDIKMYTFRLLDVDNRMIIPNETPIRIIITSSDVIHSWAMPSLGIKIDAVPGRLNQGLLMSKRTGLYFGQCSEICGANHSFMPIVIESTSMKMFNEWMKYY